MELTVNEGWDGSDRRDHPKWHVGREIPIALIFTIVIQTGAGIWFMSQLSSKVDRALEQLSEFRAERYTKEDARRDRELYILSNRDIERRLTEIEADARLTFGAMRERNK